MKQTILLSGLLMFHRLIYAQGENDTTKTYSLDEIVVTATKSPKAIKDIARSVTVFSNAEISGSLFQTPAELLSLQEGIYVVGSGQVPGSLQSLFLRGANNGHTTVLLDGIRLTDPSSVQNTIDLSELSLANTDRIEIVRGSHGTLFGTSGIGGVVNLFSKTPLRIGAGGEAEIQGGGFDSGGFALSEYAHAEYHDEFGLYILGEILNQNVRGFDATVANPTLPTSSAPRDADNFSNKQFGGKIGYKGGQSDAYFSYRRTDQKKDIDDGAFADDDNNVVNQDRDFFAFGVGHAFSNGLNVRYVGGYTRLSRSSVDDSSYIPDVGMFDGTYSYASYIGKNTHHEIQLQRKFDNIDVIVGGTLNRESMSSQSDFYSQSSFGVFTSSTDLDSLDLHTTTSAVYGYADLNGGIISPDLEMFSVAMGGRWNSHSIYGSNATIEISPSWRVGGSTLLYASFATGFNAPSLYQLGAPDIGPVSSIRRGNKLLKPERSRSLEAGLKQAFGSELRLTLAAFSTSIDDYIDYVYLWTPNLVDSLTFLDYRGDTYINSGRQTISGVEIGLQSEVNEKLFLAANTSIVTGTLKYDPANIDANQTGGSLLQVFDNGEFLGAARNVNGLSRRPMTANFIAVYKPIRLLSLQFNIRYVGTRKDVAYDPGSGPFGALGRVDVSDYTIFDFSARFFITRSLAVSLRLENVFDASYSEIQGYATRGRGVFGGVRFAL